MLYITGLFAGAKWGVWKIEESEEMLWSMLNYNNMPKEEKEKYNFIRKISSEKKRIEKLAVRVLLNAMSKNNFFNIAYSISGKPYLIGTDANCNTLQSTFISISHTNEYVAITLDCNTSCMIDIEQCRDKIFNVRERFVRDDEYINEYSDKKHLLLHWTAKEAIYKYLDDKYVELKKHLHVLPFAFYANEEMDISSGRFEAVEYKTKKRQKFDAFYYIEKDFVMTLIRCKQ